MSSRTSTPLSWRTASTCTSGATCVEIADLPDGGAAMRDKKDPAGPALVFKAEGWAGFLTAVRAGEFDVSQA